jgi:hypothetical protein
MIFGLVLLSLGLSWYFARSDGSGPNPRASCLKDAMCESGERCVVVPNPDGFASVGRCGESCESDDTCPNGWKCTTFVDDIDFLSPERGRAANLPRVKLCMHPTVQ